MQTDSNNGRQEWDGVYLFMRVVRLFMLPAILCSGACRRPFETRKVLDVSPTLQQANLGIKDVNR